MSYFCFATLMFPDYAPQIISGMIAKGYTVKAGISGDLFLSGKTGDAAHVFVIIVDPKSSKKKVDASSISGDFTAVLTNIKAKFYSTFVIVQGNSQFNTSNIRLPENPEHPSKPAME